MSILAAMNYSTAESDGAAPAVPEWHEKVVRCGRIAHGVANNAALFVW